MYELKDIIIEGDNINVINFLHKILRGEDLAQSILGLDISFFVIVQKGDFHF